MFSRSAGNLKSLRRAPEPPQHLEHTVGLGDVTGPEARHRGRRYERSDAATIDVAHPPPGNAEFPAPRLERRMQSGEAEIGVRHFVSLRHAPFG